jgi:mannose-6-phosphate isomerase-like protein (cupin superfamily)
MRYSLTNLRDGPADIGANFGGSPELHFQHANQALRLEQSGLSFQRLPPGERFPFGHTHRTQEELYIVIRGSGRIKLDAEIIPIRELDAIRVPPGVWRGYEAGPDGLELLVFGAPSLGDDLRGDVEGQRDWWVD